MSLRTLLLFLACVLFGMNAFGQTDVEKEEAQKRFDKVSSSTTPATTTKRD